AFLSPPIRSYPAATDIYTLSLHDALPIFGIAEHGSDTGNCMTESAVGCTSANGSRSVLMNPLSGKLCHVAQRPVAGPGGYRRLGHELRGDQGRPGGYPADAAGRPAFHAGGLSGGILHPEIGRAH